MKTKTCTTCKEEKELTQFYKDKGFKDGHYSKCKKCKNLKNQAYRQTEAGKLSIQKYNQSEKGRQTYDRYMATEKGQNTRHTWNTSEIGRLSFRKGVKKYKEKNPETTIAHNILNHAVERGEIERPNNCSRCEIECKPDGHHEDYSKPLEVEWLCRACHGTTRRRVA